ncbi:MAG: cation-translocating P-type ATPase [Planctomycetota bacterium]|jgi:Ca2+-transporting ATPase
MVPPSPWSLRPEAVLESLGVDRCRGLTLREVRARRRQYGPNLLRQTRRMSAWHILFDQVRSLVVALLGAAALVSFLFGEWVEGFAIAAVLVINTLLGFVAELRAVRSMEALRRLGTARVRVRREGSVREIPAHGLVPGDIVVFEGGDVVTADLRIVEASRVQADESALTGESVPVGKDVEPVAAGAPIHEHTCMLHKGTALTRGAGEAVVTSTGMTTELGRIARLVEEATEEITPLEKRLEALGRKLIQLTLVIAAVTTLLGIASGKELFLMIEIGIALAVAAIPEGLPIVATLALARGMWRMAARNALVNRLSAVEVLGATTIIFTDKTGTLTENRIALVRVALPGGDFVPVAPEAREALEIGVLCNNADHGTGDPLEVALLEAGENAGIERAALLREHPERREEAFDPATRMMATVHDGIVAVKGATEAVLAVCDDVDEEEWMRRSDAMASEGLRVLAVARKDAEGDAVYSGLTLVGLLGLLDPPRGDVRASVEACHRAGMRVIMVTGDQAATARKIGNATGIVDDPEEPVVEGRELPGPEATLYARVSPEQKLQLLTQHQEAGEVVAMTGDGVNDAPALKKADIGVAMGRRGTQVAREAADMVLKDDAFSSIVVAVRQGRIIFANIRKFVVYLLSCNLSEILIVTGAALVQAPLPLLPLQILFLNLVTDVFPALALAFGEGDKRVMERPPRPTDEGILERRHWRAIVGYALLIGAAVLGTLYGAVRVLDLHGDAATTLSFLALAFAQLWHVFNMRDAGRNPWVWGALVLCTALLLCALYVPALAALLRLVPPGAAGWLLALGMSLVPLAAVQGYRLQKTRSQR